MIRLKGRQIKPGGHNNGESSREGYGSDGSNEDDEGVGGGPGPAGQGLHRSWRVVLTTAMKEAR
jgi:hypothetical protein